MYVNEAFAMKTVAVEPGALVMGALAENGPLRFERSGRSMTGKAEVRVRNGALVLLYDDGTMINVQV